MKYMKMINIRVWMSLTILLGMISITISQSKPVTYKDYGVVLSPVDPIYVPEDYWQHIVKIKLPCLSTFVTSENFASLRDMETVLGETLSKLSTKLTEYSPPLATIEHHHLVVLGMLNATRLRIKRTQNVVTRGWGLLPESACPIPDMLRDDGTEKDPNWKIRKWTDPSILTPAASKQRRQVSIGSAVVYEMIGTKISGNPGNLTTSSEGINIPSGQRNVIGSRRASSRSEWGSQRFSPNGIQQEYQDPYDRSAPKQHEEWRQSHPTSTTTTSTVRPNNQNDMSSIHRGDKVPEPSTDTEMYNKFLSHRFANAQYLGDQNTHTPAVMITHRQQGKHITSANSSFTRFNSAVMPLISLSEWSNLEVTLCNSDPTRQTKSCTVYWAIPDDVPPLHHRQRRSICDWCGKSFKWLYGLASVEDVQETLSAVKADIGSTVEKINELTSAQSTVIDSVSGGYKALEISLQEMMTQASELKKAQDEAIHEQRDTLKEFKLMELTNYLANVITTVESYIHVLNKKLDGVETWYRNLKNSIQHQLVDVEILSGSTMDQLIASVESQLPPNRAVVPTWLKLQFLDAHSVSVFATESDVIIIYRIPLMLKSSNYRAVQVTTLPFQIGSTVLGEKGHYPTSRLRVGWQYAIVDKTNNLWAGFDKAEWNQCERRQDRVCTSAYEWHTIKVQECLPSLLIFDLPLKDKGINCEVETTSQIAGVNSAVISPLLWMISVVGPNLTMWIECTKRSSGSSTETTSTSVFGLNLIKVEPGCKATIDNLQLTGRYTYLSESAGDAIHGTEILNITGFPKVTMESLKSFLAVEKVDRLNRSVNVWDDTTSLLSSAHTTVAELRQRLESTKELKTIDPSYSNIDQLNKKLESSKWEWNWDFIPIWMYWVGGFVTTTFTVALLVRVSSICKTPTHIALAAVPPAVHEMRSFAAEITANLPGKIMPSPLLNNTNNMSLSDSIIQLTSTIHSNYYHLVSLLLGVVMLALMVYCIWMQHGHIMPIMKNMLYYQGIFPLNTTLAHHPGEAPITITVLCEFTSLLKRVARFEIGVQVATLPSPGSQWKCKPGSDGRKAVGGSISYRWINQLKIPINWPDICLQSSIINIESCSAMPSTVTIPMSDVTMQLLGNEPWLWWKVTPILITKVFVGQGYNKRIIYSYVTSYQELV